MSIRLFKSGSMVVSSVLAVSVLGGCTGVLTNPFDPSPPDGGFIIGPDGEVIPVGPDGSVPADAGPRRDAAVSRDAALPPDLGPPLTVDPVYDDCDTFAHAFDIPIRVDARKNTLTSDPALTKISLPFARGTALYSTNGLAIYDESGARLPAQFETLSRWGGAPTDCASPIKHAFIHVAAVPTAGSNATWFVRHPAAGGENTQLQIEETPEAFVFETGPARFTVNRTPFGGLSKVELNTGSGPVEVVSGGRFIIERGGETSPIHLAPWRLELERRGPQVATVVARGYYASAGGPADLGYSIRLHFYSGSSVVLVEHTYYHDQIRNGTAEGATNVTSIDRAFLHLPLSAAPTEVTARAERTVHRWNGTASASVRQVKRTPAEHAVRFEVAENGLEIERGTWARRPFLATFDGSTYALATLHRMAERDPQGLYYDANARALDVEFTSEAMQVGGARGVWSVASLDFGLGNAGLETRADIVQRHAERPQLGAPAVAHQNASLAMGPYAETERSFGPYFALLDRIHQNTVQYLEDSRITGLQIWPDMPRRSCIADGNCPGERDRLFEGGDNNYWNWSKPGLDEFFRTADGDYAHDFSLGEAITFVETLAFRLSRDRLGANSLSGLAPCYGSSRGFGGEYREGLNNRTACVGDYSYNKMLRLAYLATADRRFVDYFEEAGRVAVGRFGNPPEAAIGEELSMFRLSEQRLEVVLTGAEFGRDPAYAAPLRTALRAYADTLLGGSFVQGHQCSLYNDGTNRVLETESCGSGAGWMHGTTSDWILRTARFLDHAGLNQFLVEHGAVAARHHTVLDANGLPDYSRRGASSANNADNGWRANYGCPVVGGAIDDNACTKLVGIENDGYFYANDLTGFLNVFGFVLAADGTDPNRVCAWLPSVYVSHIGGLGVFDINDFVWGKPSGLSLGMSPEAIGALATYCP